MNNAWVWMLVLVFVIWGCYEYYEYRLWRRSMNTTAIRAVTRHNFKVGDIVLVGGIRLKIIMVLGNILIVEAIDE